MFKKHDCLICFYMDEAVREILPEYQNYIDYSRVDIAKEDGKKRFLELSIQLFGRDAVYKSLKVAPLPSLFINGHLVFETIPSRPLLEGAIREVLSKQLPEVEDEKSKS